MTEWSTLGLEEGISTKGNCEYDSLTGKGLVHNIDNSCIIEFDSLKDIILYDYMAGKTGCICHGAFDESETPFLGFSGNDIQESVVCMKSFRRFRKSRFNPTVVLKRLANYSLNDTKSISVKSLKNVNVTLPCLRSERKHGSRGKWKSPNYNIPRLSETESGYTSCHSDIGSSLRKVPTKILGRMRALNVGNTPRCIALRKSKNTSRSSQFSTQQAISRRIASGMEEFGDAASVVNCDDYSKGRQNEVKLKKCSRNVNKLPDFFLEGEPINKHGPYTNIKKEPNEINSEAAGSYIYEIQRSSGNVECISTDDNPTLSSLMSPQMLPPIPYLLKCGHQNAARKCNDMRACANANKKFELYFILTVGQGRQLLKEVVESVHCNDCSVSRVDAFIAASAIGTRPTNILVPAYEDVVEKLISKSRYRFLLGKVEETGAIEKAKWSACSSINVSVSHDEKPVLAEKLVAEGKSVLMTRKSSDGDNGKNTPASRKCNVLNDCEDGTPRKKFRIDHGFGSFSLSALSDLHQEGCDKTAGKMNELELCVTSGRTVLLNNNDLQEELGGKTDNIKPNSLHSVHATCTRLTLSLGNVTPGSPTECIQPGTNSTRIKDDNDPSLEKSIVDPFSPSPATSQVNAVGYVDANYPSMLSTSVVIQTVDTASESDEEAAPPIPNWGVICTSLPELGFVRVEKIAEKLNLYDTAVVCEPCRFENIQELKRFLNSRLADLSFPYKSRIALDWIVVTAGFLRVKTVPPTNPQFWEHPRTSKRTLHNMRKGSKMSNAPGMRKAYIVPTFLPRELPPPLLKPSLPKKPTTVEGCSVSRHETKRKLPTTSGGQCLVMNAENQAAQLQQRNESTPSAVIELPRRGHVSFRSDRATVPTPIAPPPMSGISSGILSAKALKTLTPRRQALKPSTPVKCDLAPSSLITGPATGVLVNGFPRMATFKQNNGPSSSSLTSSKSGSFPSGSVRGQPQAILIAENYASATAMHGPLLPVTTSLQSVTTMSAPTSRPTFTSTGSYSKPCTVLTSDSKLKKLGTAVSRSGEVKLISILPKPFKTDVPVVILTP